MASFKVMSDFGQLTRYAVLTHPQLSQILEAAVKMIPAKEIADLRYIQIIEKENKN